MRNRAPLLRVLNGTLLLKIPYFPIRRALILAERYGLELDYDVLASHFLAGGKIDSLIDGLVYAKENGIVLSERAAMARQLFAQVTNGTTLTEHIRSFEALGVRDLSAAPLKTELLPGRSGPAR